MLRFLLVIIVSSLSACTFVPFKEAPPKDVQALKEFPKELQGFYRMTMVTKKGKVMEGNDCRCHADVMDIEITNKTLTVYDYLPVYVRNDTIDPRIISINDSLILVNINGEEMACRYDICGNKYLVCMVKKSKSKLIGLSDSLKLKAHGGYYFLSMKEKQVWLSLAAKSEGNKIKWYSTLHEENQDTVMAAVKKYTPAIKIANKRGKLMECFNPDKNAMIKIVEEVYKLTGEYTKE